MKIPAEPTFTVAIDTREQHPWTFAHFPTEAATLQVGDYSVVGLEACIAVERKSLADFVSCCGNERDRFERELRAMRGWLHRCVIVEADWSDLERGGWRSKVKPASVVASVLGWQRDGIPFILAGNRERAADLAERFLYLSARQQWRTARAILVAAKEGQEQVKGAACKQ